MDAWLALVVTQGLLASIYYYLLIESTRNNHVIVAIGSELYHTYFINRQELA